MASTSAGSSKNDSKRSVKIIHHEKGESIVIFWSIHTFDYFFRDLENATTSPFTVNGSSGLEWCIVLHFRENTDWIAVTLKLLSPIPRDLRVTWSVAVVHHCDDSNVCDKITCGKKVMNCMSVSHFIEDWTFPRLIEKHVLTDEHENYIKNDTLTLKVKLNTYTSIMSPNCFAPSEYFKIITEEDTICNLMKHLYETRIFSDLTLIAYKSVHNKVHKSVLSARSLEFARIFATLSAVQKEEAINDTIQEVLSALLAYIYTGNPYDIGCIPLLLQKTARKHGLPLLEHFTEPNTLSFSSRIKVKQKKLVLKVKNFFSQINTEEHNEQQRIFLVDFGIGESLRNTWELFLDLRENNKIYLRLERTSCKHVPFKTVFKTFVLNNLNRYECLGTHEMMCNDFQRERCSFVMDVKNIRFNQHNHLTLQILVEVSFSLIREYNHEYKRAFFSEICEAVQALPPDFVQLKRDVFKMYNSKLYPNLLLLLARAPKIQVLVHKFMVALHSQYLVDFLDDSDEQSAIPLEDISQYDLGNLASFMYTGYLCNLELDYLGHLFVIAKLYKFAHLRRVLLEILYSNLNVGNAREIFRIAYNCEEEELKTEAVRVGSSGSDTNLSSTSQANTSGNDQVTSPHTGITSQDAVGVCQSRVETEYTEVSTLTSDETGLSSQDAVRVSQTSVESEYIKASPQTSEESHYRKKSPEPIQITVPRSQLKTKTKYVAPDPRTSIKDLDSVKKVETSKGVEHGVKSQPAVTRTNLAVKSEHSHGNKSQVVSSEQNVEYLGPPAIQQYAMELEGLALRAIPYAMRQGLIPNSRAIDKNKEPDAKSSVKIEDSEAKASLKNKDLEARSTEKDKDRDTKCTGKNNDSEVKSTEKNNDPGAKSFEKNVDFEGSTQTSAESRNWTVSPQTAEKGQNLKRSMQGKDFDGKYGIKKQKVGLDTKSSVKNEDPEAKSSVKNEDLDAKSSVKNRHPEAKSSVKNKDPEAKSSVKSKDPEEKGIEKNKDPDAKSIEKNEDPEAKSLEKNVDFEASTQTSAESQNWTVSPQTAEEGQNSKRSIQGKDFEKYGIKKQKVGLDAKSSVKNEDPEAKSGVRNIYPEAKRSVKNKDPEAKSSAKNEDPEAKSILKNKGPEEKGIEQSKDPDEKSIERNEDLETKSIEKNIDLETSTQTIRESRNLTVSPQTAAGQDSKTTSSSKRKREDS